MRQMATNTINIDGIPVYSATMAEEVDGILRISLVDLPAVMSDFQAFAEAESRREAVALSVADEDKHILRGVIMRADFPIYRVGKYGEEYYIVYSADTIRQMAEKFFADHRENAVNIMHEEGSEVVGVNLVQWYIKDAAAGINPEGFEDIADGSLFAEFHVSNPDVWERVKSGEFKGFSLEGYFTIVESEIEQGEIDTIIDALNGKFNKISKMGNLSKIKAALAAILCEMRSASSDKGVIRWDGDEELKVGDKLFTEGEEGGEPIAAPDGEYAISEADIVAVVSGGEVVEIRPIEEVEEVEEVVEDVTEEEVAVEAAEENAEESTEEVKEESTGEDIEGLRKEVNELYDIVDKILNALGESRESIESLRSEVEALKAEPAAESVTETFQREYKGGSAAERIAGARR